jgi:HAMP domain-containing protein
MTNPFGKQPVAATRNGSPRLPHVIRWILEIPLEMKLAGANLILVVLAMILMFGPAQLRPTRINDAFVVVVALTIGAMVNFALVRVALRPIESLERVAKWVSQGRLAARVPTSMVADHELARLSKTINGMLDSLAASRERFDKLGEELVYTEERDRARVAEDLYRSIGQTLADAHFQIAAAANETDRRLASAHLGQAREALRSAIDEIRDASRPGHLRGVADSASTGSLQQSFETTGRPTRMDDRTSFDLARTSLFDRRGRLIDGNLDAMASYRAGGNHQ